MAEDTLLASAPAAPADPFTVAVTPLRPGAGAALPPVPAAAPGAAFTHPFGQADGASRGVASARAGRWRIAARQALMPDTPVVGLLASAGRVVVLAPTWQLFDAAALAPVATGARGAGAAVLDPTGTSLVAIDRSGGLARYALADGGAEFVTLTGAGQKFSYDWIANHGPRFAYLGVQRAFNPHGPAEEPAAALEGFTAAEPFELGHNQLLLNGTDVATFSALAAAPIFAAAVADRLFVARPNTLTLLDWSLRPLAAFGHQFQPVALSVDATGTSHLLVTTARGPRYWRISDSGQRLLEVVLDGALPTVPTPPILGFDGRVYLRLIDHALVLDASGRPIASVQLSRPRARVVAQPDGSLLVADGTKVCRVGADFQCETLVELPEEAATAAIALAPDAILVATSTQLLRLAPAPTP